MNYFVIANDGQKYGPADVGTINQWIREGRIYPTTMLEPEGGTPVPASTVPGLIFPMVEPAAQPQPGQPYRDQPYAGSPVPGVGAQSYAQYPRGMVIGGDLPDDVKRKFNWGAFFLTWIWGLNHKQPILLLALVLGFIPAIGFLFSLGFSIWAGINANQWAWASGRFSTVQDMEDCQVIWAKWGIGVTVVSLAFACGIVGLMVATGIQGQR